MKTERSHSFEDLLFQLGNAIGNGFASLMLVSLAVLLGSCWGGLMIHPDAGVGALWELLIATAVFLAAALTVGLALNGGGAQLMRAMPCSGPETYAYLANQIARPRALGALFLGGISIGLATGLADLRGGDPFVTGLAALAAGALAYNLFVPLAWLAVIAAGRRAPQLVGGGFIVLVIFVATMGGQAPLAAWLQTSGWTSVLFRALPAHWPAVALQHLIRGDTSAALGWLVASLAAAVSLRLKLMHWLGEPFRRAATAGSEPGINPLSEGEAIAADWNQGPGFALPRALWVAVRTGGLHADTLPRRLALALLAWVLIALPCWTVLLTGPNTRPSDWRDIHTAWLCCGVLGSLLTLVKWHSLALPIDVAARLQRWGNAYPSWSLLPLTPWRTGLLRLGGVLGVAAASTLALAPVYLWRVLERSSLRADDFLMFAVLAASGFFSLFSFLLMSVAFQSIPAWWRARHPAVRLVAMVLGLALFVVPIVLVTGSNPSPAIGAYLLGALVLGVLVSLLRLWSVDRWSGNDVIEVSRQPGQGRGH